MHDPIGPIEIVLIRPGVRDPALAEDMDFAKYARTRDPALIKEREGMRAKRFVLRPLKRLWVAEYVDSSTADSKRDVMAFLGACAAVKMPDGETRRPESREGPYQQQVGDTDWMTQVAEAFGMQAVYEVGHHAWERAQLPADARGPFGL